MNEDETDDVPRAKGQSIASSVDEDEPPAESTMTENNTDTDGTDRVYVVLGEDPWMNGSWVAVSEDVYETRELAEEAAEKRPKPESTKIGEWTLHREMAMTENKTPQQKSAEEIEELRDRIAAIVTSDELESGSKKWQKLEAAEATLDWTLGEAEGFQRLVDELESDHTDEPPAESAMTYENTIEDTRFYPGDETMTEHLYQQAAQQLIGLETAIAAEYAGDVQESGAIETARRLYERHGPFELTWDSNWWSSPPEWYQGD